MRPYALIYGTLWSLEQRPVYGIRLKLRRNSEKRFAGRQFPITAVSSLSACRLFCADYIIVPVRKHAKDTPLPETRVHVENDERIDIGVHLQE